MQNENDMFKFFAKFGALAVLLNIVLFGAFIWLIVWAVNAIF